MADLMELVGQEFVDRFSKFRGAVAARSVNSRQAARTKVRQF